METNETKRKGIFSMTPEAFKQILGLPHDAEIRDMRVTNGNYFDIADGWSPILEVKVSWPGLPLEVREGEKLPTYALMATADHKECGHNEVVGTFENGSVKSEEWRMK